MKPQASVEPGWGMENIFKATPDQQGQQLALEVGGREETCGAMGHWEKCCVRLLSPMVESPDSNWCVGFPDMYKYFFFFHSGCTPSWRVCNHSFESHQGQMSFSSHRPVFP